MYFLQKCLYKLASVNVNIKIITRGYVFKFNDSFFFQNCKLNFNKLRDFNLTLILGY